MFAAPPLFCNWMDDRKEQDICFVQTTNVSLITEVIFLFSKTSQKDMSETSQDETGDETENRERKQERKWHPFLKTNLVTRMYVQDVPV